MTKGYKIGSFGFLLMGSTVFAGQASAQTATATPTPSQAPAGQDEPAGQDQLVVTGRRMPAAEAPRSATCEALARDPLFKARLEMGAGGAVFMPTRLPRDPDYSKPPTVAPGSPLPELSKSRFGVGSIVDSARGGMIDFSSLVGDVEAAGELESGSSLTQNSQEAAIDACRARHASGGGANGDFGGADATKEQRYLAARATIAQHDKTLPLGFALFDQGRYAEALPWFRKASNKLPYRDGGDEAALFVGKLYLQGLGDKSDTAEGIKWLKKAATVPYSPQIDTPVFDPRQPERITAVGEAAVILANVYRTGFGGTPKSLVEARKWYDRAYDVGHVPAAKMLGDIYYDGKGAPKDVAKAVSFYRKAAKFDHPSAQFALAQILDEGDEGVAKDRKEALALYSRASLNGHPGALYAMARAYDLGDGVPANPQRAMALYKAAALQGNAAARVAMGTYFYEGKLLPQDAKAARGWFEAAAKDGDSDGMVNLAAMLVRGEGGDKDVAGAWAWLIRAARRGDQNAPRAIAALEKRMTPEEKRAGAALLGGASKSAL
ncbi:hypothetical protein [Sphingomonas sp.]|jgi:hypothetical protein|uniref:SEL1-like repeat protein n=1 Tax=Sphingomonas sp. TaxID=28214 RepID=UPI002ED94260